jgi:2-polyprenyl-3-methyl-5-hydroxy-6-metoxy-1,4-benzoquinol methylase
MHDTIQRAKLTAILDAAYDEQTNFEHITRSIPLGHEAQEQLGRDISRASHSTALNIVAIAGEDPLGWDWVKTQVHQHPLHKQFLLQSDFISQALKKPHGYAGDKDLMIMIYRNEDCGTSPYAQLKNRVYQSLPAAEAVRQRARGMEQVLRQLPNGAKVLCLGCGPAWEVQQIARDVSLHFNIDLLDHDPKTLDYTRMHIGVPGINHVQCNAFDVIKGKTRFAKVGAQSDSNDVDTMLELKQGQYDLVYSMGLYDYIANFPMNPNRGVTGLTKRLFDFLKPSGQLIVGNFLTPGGANSHQASHRFMMEAYSEWSLIYRTPEQVRVFAKQIPETTFDAEMLDETIAKPVGPKSVIGFLSLRKR